MSSNEQSARVALARLADELAEDVMDMSDEEILAQAGEGAGEIVRRVEAAIERARAIAGPAKSHGPGR